MVSNCKKSQFWTLYKHAYIPKNGLRFSRIVSSCVIRFFCQTLLLFHAQLEITLPVLCNKIKFSWLSTVHSKRYLSRKRGRANISLTFIMVYHLLICETKRIVLSRTFTSFWRTFIAATVFLLKTRNTSKTLCRCYGFGFTDVWVHPVSRTEFFLSAM